jgi:hypothetical protein
MPLLWEWSPTGAEPSAEVKTRFDIRIPTLVLQAQDFDLWDLDEEGRSDVIFTVREAMDSLDFDAGLQWKQVYLKDAAVVEGSEEGEVLPKAIELWDKELICRFEEGIAKALTDFEERLLLQILPFNGQSLKYPCSNMGEAQETMQTDLEEVLKKLRLELLSKRVS